MSIPNLDCLKKLVNKDNSCIVRRRQKLQLLVLPVYFNNLSKGIIKALDDITIGYCQPLGGLVLGYENIQVVQGTGWLHSTNPFIHVHILATFYVFAPTKGVQIQGVVNEVSESCISFLAYGKYNVVFRISHMYALLKSTNEQQKQAGNYLKKLVYSKALSEGVVCTLQIQEAIFRDFIPHLLGYPVTDNSSTNLLVEEDIPSLATDTIMEGRTRRVHFSDEDCDSSYAKKDIQKSLLTGGKIANDVGSAIFEPKQDNTEKSKKKNKNNSSNNDSITMNIKDELKLSLDGYSSDESLSNKANLSLNRDVNGDVFTRNNRCELDLKIKEESLSDPDQKLSRKKLKVKRAEYKKQEVYIRDTEKVSFEVKDEIKLSRAKELLVKEPVAMPANHLDTKKRKLKGQEYSLYEEDLKPKKKKRKSIQRD